MWDSLETISLKTADVITRFVFRNIPYIEDWGGDTHTQRTMHADILFVDVWLEFNFKWRISFSANALFGNRIYFYNLPTPSCHRPPLAPANNKAEITALRTQRL